MKATVKFDANGCVCSAAGFFSQPSRDPASPLREWEYPRGHVDLISLILENEARVVSSGARSRKNAFRRAPFALIIISISAALSR